MANTKVNTVRKNFVETFSSETLTALRTIVKNRNVTSPRQKRSLAAYKANLTRGTYSKFIRVSKTGQVVKDLLQIA